MNADHPWRRRAHLALAVAGAGVVATLIVLPWLRYAVSVPSAGSFELEQNGLHAEPEWMGWAGLVTAVLVAGGAAAGEALRVRRHPLAPPCDRLVAGASVLTAGLLLAKFVLTLDKQDFLGSGARMSVGLAVLMLAFGPLVAWDGLRLRSKDR